MRKDDRVSKAEKTVFVDLRARGKLDTLTEREARIGSLSLGSLFLPLLPYQAKNGVFFLIELSTLEQTTASYLEEYDICMVGNMDSHSSIEKKQVMAVSGMIQI